jgi:hypothetical protein
MRPAGVHRRTLFATTMARIDLTARFAASDATFTNAFATRVRAFVTFEKP